MSTFTDVIGALENGRAFDDLNEQLGEVVNAVREHRKPGEITLTLKITPNGEHAVSVMSNIKSRAPEAARGVTTFYADAAGNLLRNDPRQPKLPFREVADDKTVDFKTA